MGHTAMFHKVEIKSKICTIRMAEQALPFLFFLIRCRIYFVVSFDAILTYYVSTLIKMDTLAVFYAKYEFHAPSAAVNHIILSCWDFLHEQKNVSRREWNASQNHSCVPDDTPRCAFGC